MRGTTNTTSIATRWTCALAAVALLIVSSGCASTTTIGSTLADPARYLDRELSLSGTVIDSYAAEDRNAYQIGDGTAWLWVLTDTDLPARGALVAVTGTLREGADLGSLAGRLPMAAGAPVLVESTRSVR